MHSQSVLLAAVVFGWAVAANIPSTALARTHQPARPAAKAARDPAIPPYPIASRAPRAAQPPSADGPPPGVPGELARWIAASHDNGPLPFMIVDKPGARIFAFDAAGVFLGSAPVLLGLARGDDAAPEIRGFRLAQISEAQRTTPAGRFVTQWGPSDRHGTMLWVDAADGISMHPMMSVSASEHRAQRIRSSDPDDHRISYGCINVPATFYQKVVLTSFRKRGGVVYILPDTRPVQEVFPAFSASLGANSVGVQASDAAAQQPSGDPLAVYPAQNDPLAMAPPPPEGGPPALADPDQPIATQVATEPAADSAKHSRRGGKHAAHRTTARPT